MTRFPDVVPVLGDGVVTLRAHSPVDVESIVEQASDPESIAWTVVPHPYSPADAHVWLQIIAADWERRHELHWAIEAADDTGRRRFAGSLDLRPKEPGVLEVGYGLHPWARGRGLMTRAVRVAAAYGFEQEGARTLRWKAAVDNWASWRVAWATGFVFDGTVPDLLDHRGEARDAWVATLRRGQTMRPATRWLEAPLLEGGRVRLRSLRSEDRPPGPPEDRPHTAGGGDPLADRFMPGQVPDQPTFPAWRRERLERMALGNGVYWTIADPLTDHALGFIGCHRLNDPFRPGSGSLTYWLYAAARGRGLMLEAVGLVADYALTSREQGGLGLRRVSAGTDIENHPSARLLVRNGFQPIGVERQAMGHPDGLTDGVLWDRLASDPTPAGRLLPRAAPVIELDGIRLRPWRESDRPAPGEGPDEESQRYLPWFAMPDHDSFRAWLATRRWRMDNGSSVIWAIADGESDRALGAVTVFRMGELPGSAGEVGYWLLPAGRGRGLATQAVAAATDVALRQEQAGGMGLRRLIAVTDGENLRSQRVLARVGFSLVGTQHEGALMTSQDAQPHDAQMFELLASTNRVAAAGRILSAVTLEGDGVRLRRWRVSDTDHVVEGSRDGRSAYWLAQLPSPYSRADAQNYLRRCEQQALLGTELHWCVADAESDACIGSLGLRGMREGEGDQADVGYWTHPSARGRGVMTAALRLAVRHAFMDRGRGGLGRRRLTLRAASDNVASRHVAEQAGFTLVGKARSAMRLGDGSYADVVWYDLLAGELSHPPLTGGRTGRQ